jgi:hypothetical protein
VKSKLSTKNIVGATDCNSPLVAVSICVPVQAPDKVKELLGWGDVWKIDETAVA